MFFIFPILLYLSSAKLFKEDVSGYTFQVEIEGQAEQAPIIQWTNSLSQLK